MSKPKILFLDSSPTMPRSNLAYKLKFEFLSDKFDGYIISSVAGPEHLTVKKMGAFEYFPFSYHYKSAIRRNLSLFKNLFYQSIALYLKNKKYAAIISPNPFVAGLIAVLVGKITKAKAIIEVNGNFEAAFKYNSLNVDANSFKVKIKEYISNLFMNYTLKNASVVRLLYKEQIDTLRLKNKSKLNIEVFSNFVPIGSFLKTRKNNQKYILSLGHPFYLKGFDILIQAFNKVSNDFPNYKLKIFGFCNEGRDFYENLAAGNAQIEINKQVKYSEVINLIANCSIFILASRTEAMGRVLIEAMASQKTIIASNVGGIPNIIKDGYNGLLFRSEDIDDLANKLHFVLTNSDHSSKLAANAYNYVQENLSEQRYIENFTKMVNKIVNN